MTDEIHGGFPDAPAAPIFHAGTCTYEGHSCAPWRISDLRGIVAGGFWTTPSDKDAAIAMLRAAYDAGRASARSTDHSSDARDMVPSPVDPTEASARMRLREAVARIVERPAAAPTNGVASIEPLGKADTWPMLAAASSPRASIAPAETDAAEGLEAAFKAGWTKCWCRDPDAPCARDGGKQAAWEAYRQQGQPK